MPGLSISRSAELALFAKQTPLFERYNYWNRLSVIGQQQTPVQEPITDIQEALVLLYEGMSDRTRRLVATNVERPDGTHGPVVRIEIYASGYTKEEFTKRYDFPLAKSALDELIRANVLSGQKEWGFTDMTQLRLNDNAIDLILDSIDKYSQEHPIDTKRRDGSAQAPPDKD